MSASPKTPFNPMFSQTSPFDEPMDELKIHRLVFGRGMPSVTARISGGVKSNQKVWYTSNHRIVPQGFTLRAVAARVARVAQEILNASHQ